MAPQTKWIALVALIIVLPATLGKILKMESSSLAKWDKSPLPWQGMLHHGKRRSKRDTRMTPDEINAVLDLHNNLRRQEGSSNMQKMRWNDYIADMAQEWSDNCAFRHGFPSRTNPPYDYVRPGQNLFVISAPSPMLEYGVQLWYDEKPDYNYNDNSCDPDPQKPCGHYTQLVWAESNELGCGYTFCSTVTNTALTNAYLLTCNYGPPGNFAGQKPFRKGTACSRCATGLNYCDDGLCDYSTLPTTTTTTTTTTNNNNNNNPKTSTTSTTTTTKPEDGSPEDEGGFPLWAWVVLGVVMFLIIMSMFVCGIYYMWSRSESPKTSKRTSRSRRRRGRSPRRRVEPYRDPYSQTTAPSPYYPNEYSTPYY